MRTYNLNLSSESRRNFSRIEIAKNFGTKNANNCIMKHQLDLREV